MTEPVLVIHGVGNRDEAAFNSRVAKLQDATGNTWNMVPVYWGDLAAHEELVAQTVPRIDGIRAPADIGVPDTAGALLFGATAAPLDGVVRESVADSHQQIDAVLRGARAAGGAEVRDGDRETPIPQDLEAAVRDEWPQLTWLRHVTDPEALERIGNFLAPPLSEAVADTSGQVATRDGATTEVRLSWPDVGGFAKRRLHELDELVGSLIRDSAGRLNEFMRSGLGPPMTKFFGDVLVYQRHRDVIHQRVRDKVAALNDPELGTEKHPVLVTGHSLGGVIAFDLAVLPDTPLWTRSLVTFGSQAPFFHVCDPRERLAPFGLGQHVKLPKSVGRWTNLWESLDVVAFIAANVFVLDDGSAPEDIEVPHLASSGVWTHSVYWETPELFAALNNAFA
ncbi:MAG: lipase family protein [Actinomycetota bacterium]|nr:lipase family protein [Actinomycetota bacterium]